MIGSTSPEDAGIQNMAGHQGPYRTIPVQGPCQAFNFRKFWHGGFSGGEWWLSGNPVFAMAGNELHPAIERPQAHGELASPTGHPHEPQSYQIG